MLNLSAEDQVQKMLSIIYQIPIGLIEANYEGNITQMNAKSVQLLMPLFFSMQLPGDNINELLEQKAPDLLLKIQQFTGQTGNIVNQLRQEIVFEDQHGRNTSQQYIFTVNKLSADTLMYVFEDITEVYEKEKLLNQILQDKAIEQNKFEIAAGVLHDIGNAIVGFGSYITKIKRLIEQNDLGTIENLKGFIEKNLPSISSAIGEAKAKALLDLLAGFISEQHGKLKDIKGSVTDQMKIIGHIQEILNIQRQYVRGDSMEREPVNIRSVLNDTVAMIFGNLDKNSIAFNFDSPSVLPKLKGDRTKLMQVFLNIFKNAVDAVTSSGHKNKEINAKIIADDKTITVKIEDNGTGFAVETGEQLFSRGYTTKTEGTGLGLVNCRGIIESHNGEITLTSAGIGKGATATIIFKL
jgi:signal transduction histidine kinase